ncbi:PREDICTED: apoptosis facilitator Bcl-2-like protein 14 [Elephantulus edwardii]|uniref:apoptosis facilitator Bcl-2-like protein 14 n=1 Tax=Elephantulus edwardii TaxID=28737 RepID=UPI0003F0F1A3|nr:PREDICTED: apoptosis facilitator Bcl-2-like protein 14 [Elephantulus edwardii]
MCTSRDCDLEEIPLDDDDSDSIEFKILAFYAKHHVYKNTPAVYSSKLTRTRSLSQKGLGSWSTSDPWTLVPRPPRTSQSTDKSFAKKSPWRVLFEGGTQKEDSRELHNQGVFEPEGLSIQRWSRLRFNAGPHIEPEAVNPKVVSIANRVAEIVHSWPPPEDSHTQGASSKFKGRIKRQGLIYSPKCLVTESSDTSTKKDEEDQIIAKIVELLKYSGDQLDNELRKDKALMSSLQDGLNHYSVFKTITDKFLTGVDTRGESEAKAWGFKAALAIDIAAKLTAIDNHPMNRVLGFGTKYLQDNFSPWIQRHGGWEKVLGISNEEID